MPRSPEPAVGTANAKPTAGHPGRDGSACVLAVAFGAAVVLGVPSARLAHAQLTRDPWPRTTLATEALTGGIARLRAPVAEMIRVPRSSFRMGSTVFEVVEAAASCQRSSARPRRWTTPDDENPCQEARFAVELERHQVTLSSYWLDRVEVSVAAYRRCAELHRCAPLPYHAGGERFERPELPASLVRWKDAQAYCWFRGARLPTEAEFERAARGVGGRRFPWGETFHRAASNHGRFGWDRSSLADGYAELAPVGSFPAGRSPEGFLDLSGNVAEWASDLFTAPYSSTRAVDPKGPPNALMPGASSARVLRGGSYQDPAAYHRGAARVPEDGNARSPSYGFRCARSGGTGAHAP
ncbi:MAG: formylglycine-generating enzyme family protein [Polyangiaceae bacterium]|nr:formylglycine-generating enzyme family protein [Polyangiaceae bacterium]